MRPIVQYDDISLSYDDATAENSKEEGPSTSTSKSAMSPPAPKKRKTYEPKPASRELTHEEIWDDSALIEAWNAAEEEYEVRFLSILSIWGRRFPEYVLCIVGVQRPGQGLENRTGT
jgi:hypothetical protein